MPLRAFSVCLVVALSAAGAAQKTTLSYVDANPCCLAADGHGSVFVVGAPATETSVTKVDSNGAIVSTFHFLAGVRDNPQAAAVDSQGHLWIVGSTGYPVVQGLITELDSTGTTILFSGTFGGIDPKGATVIRGIAFDPDGNAYVGGSTSQADFPVSDGGFKGKFGKPQETFGWMYSGPTQYGFVARLLVNRGAGYSIGFTALLGGEQLLLPPCPPNGQCSATAPFTTVSALAVDAGGVVTAAGLTDVADFPVTEGAFQTQCRCDSAARVGFVTRLNPQGTALAWSTFLGSRHLSGDMTVGGIALDSAGNVVIDGTTPSPDFPVTPGAIQPALSPQAFVGAINGFVTKVDSTGTRLLFSTFYGGAIVVQVSAPRLDSQDNIWLSEQIAFRSGMAFQANSLTLGSSSASALIAELAADG